MGRRPSTSSFMPDWYVFPGGRVDPCDAEPPRGVALRPDVAARLERRGGARQATGMALAMAAIRETFEETGLLVGQPCPNGDGAGLETPFGQACAAAGVAPALGELDYIARAITPTRSPKRFNARFFTVDAVHARGDLGGSGELADLRWVRLDDPGDLPIADVTAFVLGEAARWLAAPATASHRVPILCYIGLTPRILHE